MVIEELAIKISFIPMNMVFNAVMSLSFKTIVRMKDRFCTSIDSFVVMLEQTISISPISMLSVKVRFKLAEYYYQYLLSISYYLLLHSLRLLFLLQS